METRGQKKKPNWDNFLLQELISQLRCVQFWEYSAFVSASLSNTSYEIITYVSWTWLCPGISHVES